MEYPADAISDAEIAIRRFKINGRGALVHRVGEERV